MKRRHQHACSAWVEEWLAEGTWASATVRAYRLELRRWLAYVNAEGAPASLTEKGVLSFLDHLSSSDAQVLRVLGVGAPLKASSLTQARRILGGFLLWLARHERVPVSVALAIRSWRPSAHHDAQAAAVRPKSRTRKAPRAANDPRARLAQGLAGWLGVTPKELSLLRCGDIQLRRGMLEVWLPVGAGQGWRVGPSYLASDWKKVRRETPKASHVFVNRESLSPLSVGHIGRLIAHAASPMTASPRGGARAQKRAAAERLIMGGFTHSELLYHFRRTTLPRASQRIRERREFANSLDGIVVRRAG